jgi:hypothetical protein
LRDHRDKIAVAVKEMINEVDADLVLTSDSFDDHGKQSPEEHDLDGFDFRNNNGATLKGPQQGFLGSVVGDPICRSEVRATTTFYAVF